MTLLASDVFAAARVFLNDSAAVLFTNAAILPHLQAANEELEQKLIIYDVPIQRVVSSVIPVDQPATSLTILGVPALPTDFLLPISLHERLRGDTAQSWSEMTERDWEPENQIPTTEFRFYAFRNNAIYFPASTVNRDILLKYDRQLAVITGPNSPEDFSLSKRWLAARTAELAARYIGMNADLADQIALRETEPRADDIERIFTLNGQNNRVRRRRYKTQKEY